MKELEIKLEYPFGDYYITFNEHEQEEVVNEYLESKIKGITKEERTLDMKRVERQYLGCYLTTEDFLHSSEFNDFMYDKYYDEVKSYYDQQKEIIKQWKC